MTLPILAITMPGPMEMFLIFMVVIVLFGAKRLPELARSLGKSAIEFKKAKKEFDKEINSVKNELTLEDSEEDAEEQTAGYTPHGSSTRPDRT